MRVIWTKALLAALSPLRLSSKCPSEADTIAPVQEKQTCCFDFITLTCEQHDRTKSPTAPKPGHV